MAIVTPKTNFIFLLEDLIDYLTLQSINALRGTYAEALKRRCVVALKELEDIDAQPNSD